jgi:SAM-dependent methyltransferase
MFKRTLDALKSKSRPVNQGDGMVVRVLELASDDNLDEESYLTANVDVRRAGMSARHHFNHYGRAEGRHQFTRDHARGLRSHRAGKFDRFKDVIDLGRATTPCGAFPISFGDPQLTLDDYVHESANPGFAPFEQEKAANPDRLYLDIGCGLRTQVSGNCLYLEVYPSRTADIVVEPSCEYPIKSSSIDGIGCFAVLEHTRKPWLVAQEIHRILKPGGKAFIDWPFLQPVHGYPSHYFNATREGLRSVFLDQGFDIERCETGAHQTPAYTVNWILREMLNRLPEGAAKQELRGMTIGELSAVDPRSEFWLRIMDQLPDAALSEFACGNWLLATKT